MARKSIQDRYDPPEIETQWQQRWTLDRIYDIDLDCETRPPYYFLVMLPYPSGDLHIGHWYIYAPSDTRARYLRMCGYNVFLPIGFDAFGLPAENAAIKRGVHPADWTYSNIENMRKQLRSIGAIFAWNHEVITCDPSCYRWNQSFFLKMFKQGLAYRKFAPVDWCPSCNTTLAREQVIGKERFCERCDTPVVKKDLFQWFLKITDYAEELLDFSKIKWPERVQVLQQNWIGRSEGAEIFFKANSPEGQHEIRVFTTRPDTLWGATFLVLAPEHPLVKQLITPEQHLQVEQYIAHTQRYSEIERIAENRQKTGVFTGTFASNPATGNHIPIWIGDFVLPSYGTGAIMGVPAHDDRDLDFAHRFKLPIVQVILPPNIRSVEFYESEKSSLAYTILEGIMINSGPLNGVSVGSAEEQSIPKAIAWLETSGWGHAAVTYRLRDWLISRQRYWGTPIPIVYCRRCGTVPLPDQELPVELPRDVDFKSTGENPLKLHPTWQHTKCPDCGGPAERETDTMDTFVDSSWYQYRYLNPMCEEGPLDPRYKKWLPVVQYTGGIEHAVMHLLYTRFWTKMMRDFGFVEFGEPMIHLFNQGIILGSDGQRMSKSRGNVVDPDELVRCYGSDTVRCFLMFLGPWDQGGPWNPRGIGGIYRWLGRIWELALPKDVVPRFDSSNKIQERHLQRQVHQTIRDVGDFTKNFRFNTAIAKMMELTNVMARVRESLCPGPLWDDAVDKLLLILAPYAPHLAEELWIRRGKPYSIHQQCWPDFSTELATEEEITIAIQVNGKLRDTITVSVSADESYIKQEALKSKKIVQLLGEKKPSRVIVVPRKVINIVV